MGFYLLVLFWLNTGAQPAPAYANEAELKRLQKCYGIMVGTRILKSDPLYVAVSSGALSGTDACMSVFDKATLGADGKIPFENGLPNPVGHKVLSNFVEFHRSNLQSPDFFVASGGSRAREMDIFDTNETAFHFVYSLFKPGEPYSNVAKRLNAIRAIRYTARTTPRTKGIVTTTIEFLQGPSPTPIPWTPTLIETGMLAGLVPDTIENPIQLLESSLSQFQGRNTNAHFGGGFMGSQTYLHASWNNKNFRIWATNLMADALCKDMPTLRSIDVLQSVKPESTFPWRQGISCMQCHDSMDPLSAAIRNNLSIRSHQDANGTRFWVTRTVDKPSAPYPSLTNDADFSRRPPDFTLRYRSYNGSLVEINSTGLSELGNIISTQEDFYVCAAKRYFELFTGIEVNIKDDSDPLNPLGLSKEEKKYRDRVIDLGLKLKDNQSGRELIKQIISSQTFIDTDKGV